MKLKEYRKKQGMTQTQLAKKLGVSQSAVAMWETGKATPALAKIYQLARVYGVSDKTILAFFKDKKPMAELG